MEYATKLKPLVASEIKDRDLRYLINRKLNREIGKQWVSVKRDNTITYMKRIDGVVNVNTGAQFKSNLEISHFNFRVWLDGNRNLEFIVQSSDIISKIRSNGETFTYEVDWSKSKTLFEQLRSKNFNSISLKEVFIHVQDYQSKKDLEVYDFNIGVKKPRVLLPFFYESSSGQTLKLNPKLVGLYKSFTELNGNHYVFSFADLINNKIRSST